ncbi:hypothetical protein IAH97_00110 [Neoehrlichia mikurensis]|uniref:Uncharacterized protein n=1 Tax=Neoehrlichia mikurensis TaxID=89586 RepID=A0A9Q9BXX5_9RICK|nr:hypothetical protein [Neoehrlichia mikurensis]QXK91989.1 hypothetical protein IAH97_00110 [Neoehrlichia mikurensis]UTO55348.1 hypothetical protein LUA82_04170 [Neoehrlichia mikurensis]UTO56269.1 hypothetical protein LUA81_04135 [Neoehrlichia mikurensis]
MSNILEEIIELKMHIIYIITKEIEYLRTFNFYEFKALQVIEGDLLILLNDKYNKIKNNKNIILYCTNDKMIETLSMLCIKFDKYLMIKHNIMAKYNKLH